MPEWIERETLMKYPIRRNHYDKKNGSKDFINGVESVLEYAENLPAADVEPVRHGEWKICCDGYYPYCSVCKEEPIGRKMSKYCPNCGAKMDLIQKKPHRKYVIC